MFQPPERCPRRDGARGFHLFGFGFFGLVFRFFEEEEEGEGLLFWVLEDFGVSQSSCEGRLFLFGGCCLSSLGLCFFSLGTSLKKAALLHLKPHSPANMAALMILCFIAGESTVTLIGGVLSLLEVFFAGRAPTLWCGLMSMPWLPTLSVPSFMKSWYSSLSWTPPAVHSKNSLGSP